MKRITKYFPTFTLLIITCLTVIMLDMKEKELYDQFSSYEQIGFIVPENNENITNDTVNKLFDKAKEIGVLLVKQVYNEKTDSVEIYITSDDLNTTLDKNLATKTIGKQKKDSFMATFQTNSSKQSDYIPDFLNNDRFTFYKMDALLSSNLYKLGSYTAYYDSYEKLDQFMAEAEIILSTPKDKLKSEHWGHFKEHTNLIFVCMLICIVFFILFYFLIVLFQLYRETKKIGCLLLLGFNKSDITRIMTKRLTIFMFIFSLISILLCMFMLPNAKLDLLFTLLLIDGFIIVLTLLLSHFALIFIQRYAKTSNILKKESVLERISNLCLVTKCLVVGGIVLFVISLMPLIQSSTQSIHTLKDNKQLMDYAVFSRIHVDNSQHDDYAKYLSFFQDLENNNIDYIYVMFNEYLNTNQEITSNYEEMEKEGNAFRTASVDKNYLSKYPFSCYDEKGNKIDINKISKEFYLLPKSKISYTENLRKRAQERNAQYNINEAVDIYYYEDQQFDTYDSTSGIKQINSPILRVIDKYYPYTYFEHHTGIDVAGTGMATALKFNIAKDDDFFHSKLLPCVKKAGLEDVLTESNFVSYKNYYNDELTKFYQTSSIFFGGMIASILLYIILVVQTFILFIDSRMNEILVQLILGFSKKDIFKKIFFWNISVTLVPICALLVYSIISKSFNLPLVLIVCASFLVFDLLLLLIIIKMIKFENIYTKLKGE